MARMPRDRKRVLIAVLVLAVAGFGCNPLLAPLYLFGVFNKPVIPPELNFYERAKEEKGKKLIKVVILPSRGNGVAPDLIGSEERLAALFSARLAAGFAENKEKVVIVPLAEVKQYKNEQSDLIDAYAIGKHFQADYVIDIELSSLSLFPHRSQRHFLQGQAHVALTVIDVDKKGDEGIWRKEHTRQYPSTGPQPIDVDNSPEKFLQGFLARLATDLSWYLTAHPTSEHHTND